MKVTGLELISEMVAERELQKKKERDVRKDRINQLIAQGIEKEIAEVMVDAYTSCGF